MATSGSALRDLALAVGAGLVGPPLGVATGFVAGPWLSPVISTLLFYPLFRRSVRTRSTSGAFGITMAWVLAHSVVSITLAHYAPMAYEAATLNGVEYREEMFHWIETGIGAEGNPAQFLPIHAVHFVAFVLLCWATRAALGLLLGVILLNYMNCYVGALTHEGPPALLALVGWHPWAVLRVAGFLLAAITIVRPRSEGDTGPGLSWTVVGVLIVSDAVLKTLLAPTWREFLRSLMMG